MPPYLSKYANLPSLMPLHCPSCGGGIFQDPTNLNLRCSCGAFSLDTAEIAMAAQSGESAVIDLLVLRLIDAAHVAAKYALIGMKAAQYAKHTEWVFKKAPPSFSMPLKPGDIVPLDSIEIVPVEHKGFDWAFLSNEINKSAFFMESTAKGFDELYLSGPPVFKTKHKKYKASVEKVKKDSVKLDALTPALAEFMKDYTE